MTQPTCPHCGLSDQAYKISLLYLQATERLNQSSGEESAGSQPELDSLLRDLLPEDRSPRAQKQMLLNLVQAIRPPASGKAAVRRVHPDLMVGFFAVLAIVLLYQIASDQPGGLVPAAGLLAASLIVYAIFRRALVNRHERAQQQEQADRQRVEQAIAEWMQFYYCSRDEGVYDPHQGRLVPLEQIKELYTVR